MKCPTFQVSKRMPRNELWAVDVSFDGQTWYPVCQGFPTEDQANKMLDEERGRYPASSYRIRSYVPPEVVNA